MLILLLSLMASMCSAGEVYSAGKPIEVHLELPKGWKINKGAPSSLSLKQGSNLLVAFRRTELRKEKVILPAMRAGKTYRLHGKIYYCEATKPDICVIHRLDEKLSVAEVGLQRKVIRLPSVLKSASPKLR